MQRKTGVLMHLSSLYGDHSIGSFGKEAKEWIDFLERAGISYWQVLPFCMTDECHSPYKSCASFCGNPMFIDLPSLHAAGYITAEELSDARQSSPYACEYERLDRERLPLLFRAAARARASMQAEVDAWLTTHSYAKDIADFLTLRALNDNLTWQEWHITEVPSDEASQARVFAWQWIQYIFTAQWTELRRYANERGIRIIGDLPIYVAADSVDVRANPEEFLLDAKGYPTAVAGVPPDYFCEDGQLWGNPLYDWKKMKANGYRWWRERISYMLALFDGIRIDHFRGFASFWQVPADAKTAKEGKWVKGPGRDLLRAIRDLTEGKLIIAEDLGDITPDVESLLEYSGFPGMRVLQFAFLGDPNSPHLPHHYPRNTVAYTGTHDNNTLLGFVWEQEDGARRRLLTYCGANTEHWNTPDTYRAILRTMMASHADTVIFPIQDLLMFGADTRMNIPGSPEGNWRYRITKEQLQRINLDRLRHAGELFSRI